MIPLKVHEYLKQEIPLQKTDVTELHLLDFQNIFFQLITHPELNDRKFIFCIVLFLFSFDL